MTNKEINVKNIDKAEAAKRAKGYYGDYSTEARIAYSSFLDGCDWKEQQMIDKACKTYRDELLQFNSLLSKLNSDYDGPVDVERSLKNFKKAMEGGEE